VLRIRIGEAWRSDPRLQAALRHAGPGRTAAVRDIVDVLAIEVDGVDIAAGRTEGPVVETAAALVAAVGQLAAGAPEASIPFQEGAVELLLRRRGGSALLSVVRLSRPARVLAHEVEVDLEALAAAAREAATEWCRHLEAIAPPAATLPEIRRLLRAAGRAARVRSEPAAGPSPAPRVLRTRRRAGQPACSFEVHDDDGRLLGWRGRGADLASLLVPGRVTLRRADGREILSLPGAPYLLLRDLAAAAHRLASTGNRGQVSFALAPTGRRAPVRVDVDVVSGELSVDGRRAGAVDPLALARAFLEAAVDFCAVVTARNPAQARNSRLSDLRDGAAEGLAHVRELADGDRTAARSRRLRTGRPRRPAGAPVGPGRLRRVSFRRMAIADVGLPSGAGLQHAGGAVVACGRAAVLALEAGSGQVRWRAPGAEVAAVAEDRLVTASAGVLSALDLATGAAVWARPSPLPTGAPRELLAVAGGRVAAVAGGSAWTFDASSGAPGWAFDSAGALRLDVGRFGPMLVAAADTGLVHGLDPEGRVAWRLRAPGPAAAAPVAGAGACLLLFRTPLGAALVAVDAATGRRRFEAPLDLSPTGPPVPFSGRIAIPGTVAGDPIVAVLESDGAPAWTGTLPLGTGPIALASAPGSLLAKTADGACALVGRDGAPLWVQGARGTPAVGNLPPVAWRGLVLVPGEDVVVLDLRRGRPVGQLPAAAPAWLLVAGEDAAWTLDGEGLVVGARLESHLAVVDGDRGSPPRRPG
jgi:outer membrane protein assembly factor BamB